jgi:hypothetical protein
MFGHRLGWLDMATQSWIELVLSMPIVFWAGWPFLARGAQSVIHHSANMWTLISMGTGSAFVYGVVAKLAPQVFPDSFISMGRVAVYFEAAAVIISLTLLGQMLELKARSQSFADIKSLLGGWRPRRHGASPLAEPKRTSRSPTCTSATSCACGPARRCRSMVSSSKAAARWTSRCSRASPSP